MEQLTRSIRGRPGEEQSLCKMRTAVLCLAALCVVLPLISAKPACGCGACGACGVGAKIVAKKSSARSAKSASASASSESYEATTVVAGGCLSEAEIKVKYARISGESVEAYYKRILARNYAWTKTTEAYLKTLSIVWKDFYDLDLWYDVKYVSLTKEFYTLYYAKLESESWEVYYARLLKRNAWETDELFAKRVLVVRDCFPSYDLWLSEKWFDKYTRSVYALAYKKWSSESEEAYIKRIITRDVYFDTCDKIWAKRIFLIQEATLSTCSLWYSEKYVSYFKDFYSFWYKPLAGETAEAWLTRTLALLPGETPENALIRIKFIKTYTSDCGFWKADYFQKIFAAKALSESWLVKVRSAFFPCGCGGASVAIKKSSAKSASSSSASASEESASVVVKA